jgi:hypothetical protein
MRTLAEMKVAPQVPDDVAFYVNDMEPRVPLTYEEGMAWLQSEEKRQRNKFNTAVDAQRSRGAHFAAEAAAHVYRKCRRHGKKALQASPLTLMVALAEARDELGYAKTEREIDEEVIVFDDDEAAEAEASGPQEISGSG